VEAVLDAGEFPSVLDGDCTIVLGSMLALRRRGRDGLFFIDGLMATRTSSSLRPSPTAKAHLWTWLL
jgi:arginase family enzyme